MLTAIDYMLLWLRALALRVKATARRIWATASLAELYAVGWLAMLTIVGSVAVATGQEPWYWGVILAGSLWAYLDLLNDATRVRVSLWQLAQDKPSGAPAALVVRCPGTDGGHRMAYTGGAWQEIK